MYSKEKIFNILRNIEGEASNIKPYVIVCQPRRSPNDMPAQNINGQLGLHIDMVGYSHAYVEICGELIDSARNYLIEQALSSGAEYLLFIGDDTVLPYDAFTNLLQTVKENPKSCAVGVYYVKNSSPMIMIRKNNMIYPADVSCGQIFEVWQAGMDAMLIPITLLREMKEKEPDIPFTCIYSSQDNQKIENLNVSFIGEDNFFYFRVRQYGWKVLCNTNVQCLHIDRDTGKYTASNDIDLENYYTNIPITERLTLKDKKFLDKKWIDTLPKPKLVTESIAETISSKKEKPKLEIKIKSQIKNSKKNKGKK